MKITILYKGRKLFNVAMNNDMSVDRLRELIEETRLIPQDKQTLTFDGRVLENGKLLMQDYGAIDKSEITLSMPLDFTPNFKVYIKIPGGLVVKRIVNRTELVSNLKWSIEDATKIPVSQQALSYGSWLLEDNMRLGEYNLQNGSVIRLLRRGESSGISTIGSQDSRTRSIENYEERGLPSSQNSSGISVAESTASKRTSIADDIVLKKPSPIKRLEPSKILQPEKINNGASSPGMPEKLELPLPPPPPPSQNPRPAAIKKERISNGESLRLNLTETEAYKNFRQVLGEQMAQNGTQ